MGSKAITAFIMIAVTISLANLIYSTIIIKERNTMEVTTLENAPLKIKFFTAAYSPEVDNYLNEILEKFIYEDLSKLKEISGAPTLFLSSNKDILIAVPYKELILSEKNIAYRVRGMDEEELQSFSNWESTLKDLRDKGYKISIK